MTTVMVVDDEEAINKSVGDLLKTQGYDIISAFSGEEALDILKDKSPNLILVDLFMPGMSGIELCEEIRKNQRLEKTSIAFVTVAAFSKEGMQKLKKLKVKDCIKKPFEIDDFVKRVNRMVD